MFKPEPRRVINACFDDSDENQRSRISIDTILPVLSEVHVYE